MMTFPVAYYVLPAVFLDRLASVLPSTTLVELILQVVCKLYWTDQYSALDSGDLCAHPRVQQLFSLTVTVLAAVGGVGGFLMYGPISHLSGKYGRKPVMLMLVGLSMSSFTCLLVASRVHDPLQNVLLITWTLLAALTGEFQFNLLVNMFIVDSTSPEERTSTLSFVQGCAALGGMPAFALGGIITRRTHNTFTVFYIALALAALNFLYIWLFLPESFCPEKREQLRHEKDVVKRMASSQPGDGIIGGIKSTMSTFLHPLALLRPQRDAVTGRYNLRMMWCGLHSLVGYLGAGYIGQAMIVYLTTHEGYKPDDNGYMLTAMTLSSVVSLTVLQPLAIKYGRPAFNRRFSVKSKESSGGDLEDESTRFDVILMIFGWLISIVSVAMIPYMHSRGQVLAAVVLMGISVGRIPAFRTVIAATVEPVRTGEALSTVEMTGSIGLALSCIILGSLLSATISTIPALVFWVYAGIGAVSIVILFFIRDEDRYQVGPPGYSHIVNEP